MKPGGGHGPNLLGGRERAMGGGELAPSSLGEAAGGGERRDRWRRREKRGLSPFLRASRKSFFRERAAGEIGEGASVGSCMQAVDPRPPVPKQRTRDHQKEESSAVLRTYITTEQHESSAAYTFHQIVASAAWAKVHRYTDKILAPWQPLQTASSTKTTGGWAAPSSTGTANSIRYFLAAIFQTYYGIDLSLFAEHH